MAELRDKTVGFAAKQSERDRIDNAAKFLEIRPSDFMREPVMNRLEKVEKQMKKNEETS